MAVKKNLPELPKKETAVVATPITAADNGSAKNNTTPVENKAVKGSQFSAAAYDNDAKEIKPVTPAAGLPEAPKNDPSGGGYLGGYGGYSAFRQSDAVTQAMALTNNLLAQLTSGKTSYSDRIAALISEYQNRDPFAYNPDEDMMFQNALASAMRSGQTAMMDTMGQAAALTGGYGSTYATTAGNNAYNQYIQGAYDDLPEYYNMALDAYTREGDAMLTELGILSDADATEYERLYNAYSQNYANAMNMYDQEYAQWESANAWRMNQAELNYKYAALAQDQKQYEAALAQEQAQYEASLNQGMDPELAYKYVALAQEQAQFDAEMAYKNSKAETEDYDDPTPEMMEAARKAYRKKGEQGLYDYVYKYPGYDIEAMLDYAYMD